MQDIWIVDAFTSEPFGGNPAAVCVMNAYPEDETLQNIALEMNLSETAFAVPVAPLQYKLRWFTPSMEVNLCGHATLATTQVLREIEQVKVGDMVTYETLSGLLRARLLPKTIELDLPLLAGKTIAPHSALNALGVDICACQINRDNYLVEVADYEALMQCAPNFAALRAMDAQGVIVTCAYTKDGFDFASRYFAPNCGIDEDPVCGSAHCFLAPYWAEKLGKTQFRALQASKRRGILDVTMQDGRVLIAGSAITTMKGQLLLPDVLIKERTAC